MVQVLIQNIIFIILVAGLGFTIKILKRKFQGLKGIFMGVILLWFGSMVNFIYGYVMLSLFFMLVGAVIGFLGLRRLLREMKDLTVDSIDKAMDLLIKKTGAKAGLILSSEGGNLKCIYRNGSVNADYVMMLSFPIRSDDDIIGYIVLYGDEPIVKFDEKSFESELAFIKLYIENHRLNEKLNSVGGVEEIKRKLSEYIGLISHDLKKPLTGIIGFTEILSFDFKNLSDEEIAEFIGNIKYAGNEMLRILECLREISEIELGKGKLNFEKVNLYDEIKGVVSNFVKEIKKKLDIILDFSGEIEIDIDKAKFDEIIYQLVSSIVKFPNVKAVKVSIYEFEDGIEINLKGDEFNGVRTDGFGIGFLIAKAFAEMHGGKVNFAESGFKLWLPMKRQMDKFAMTVSHSDDLI